MIFYIQNEKNLCKNNHAKYKPSEKKQNKINSCKNSSEELRIFYAKEFGINKSYKKFKGSEEKKSGDI